jgi:DNA-3-methyladenine glycosylase I
MSEVSVYTSWMYRKGKPPTDSAYFENMTRCVFQAGLSWAIVSKRWPAITEAFERFDIGKVAGYGSAEITRLMADSRILRNRRKILATIHNAREFERVVNEKGSVSAWLSSLDKSNNYVGVIRRISSRFKHMGNIAASIWLYSVGEDIDIEDLVKERFGY